ncbi:phosphodiesterase [Sneathiella chinensis]|uniref:3',5'-cyclic adenosine monophosphate phosphodiesterase CpdA n=1 Tax=Sneathiella chinensis TaxID=349750 RepID=A0ABQ5U6J7_9PROT|nr:phosphodiesterase [Sneathiella chinensis]GLQ07544.1 3',5'-cyclic adenosine monophosphate phosphodiesterase CpdA [Sneathiella chinensis]
MIIAQMSDPHISVRGSEFDNLYHTADRLDAALAHVNALSVRPDLIMMTGDLVDAGSAEEYQNLKASIDKSDIPVYLGIGNHDCRDTIRTVFTDADYMPKEGFLQYVVETPHINAIMLDTNIPQYPGGILCRERLDWLDATLSANPDKPTLIFMHHPPFDTGIRAMDQMSLQDRDSFGAVIEKHSNITRIFCGHLHRPIQAAFHGTCAQVCPSTSHQILLHLEESERLATVAEPPAYLLHMLNSDKRDVVTHMEYVKDYPMIWELEGDLY